MEGSASFENEEAGPDTSSEEVNDLSPNLGRQALEGARELVTDNYPYDDYGMDSMPYGWG